MSSAAQQGRPFRTAHHRYLQQCRILLGRLLRFGRVLFHQLLGLVGLVNRCLHISLGPFVRRFLVGFLCGSIVRRLHVVRGRILRILGRSRRLHRQLARLGAVATGLFCLLLGLVGRLLSVVLHFARLFH